MEAFSLSLCCYLVVGFLLAVQLIKLLYNKNNLTDIVQQLVLLNSVILLYMQRKYRYVLND